MDDKTYSAILTRSRWTSTKEFQYNSKRVFDQTIAGSVVIQMLDRRTHKRSCSLDCRVKREGRIQRKGEARVIYINTCSTTSISRARMKLTCRRSSASYLSFYLSLGNKESFSCTLDKQ